MKQICKRLSVMFLALTIISGTVLTTGIVAQADTYKVLFSDEFNSYNQTTNKLKKEAMNDNGWNTPSNTQGSYNTGAAYEIPHNVGTNINVANWSGSSAWTDYNVRVTLTLLSNEDATGLTRAGITGRLYASDNVNQGYDLLVVKEQVTDIGAILLLRCDGEDLTQVSIPRLGNDVPFNLKLEFRGTNLYGYLNDELKISYDTANDETKYTSGWAGIRKTHKSGLGVRYDNFIVSENVAGIYPEGYLYYNNFDATSTLEVAGFHASNSLKNSDPATISSGVFNLKAGGYAYLRDVAGSYGWEDYTVEADVAMIKGDSDSSKGYAGIVARSTDGKNDGYEFRMDSTGSKKSLALAKRNGTTSELGTKEWDFAFNDSHKMIMTVCGDNIMCWFDGTLVFDVVDPDVVTYSRGYAGIRSTGGTENLNSKVDNFSVRTYQKPTVTYPDGYLYCNDFESEARLTNEGWLNDGKKANGVYTLDGSSNNYLTGVDASKEWADYVVEADVMLHDDGTEPQYAGIVGRSTEPRGNGYEFIIVKDDGITTARLYKRGVYSGMINSEKYQTEVTLESGQMNYLKMVLDGTDIYCYLNGELVFEVTDNDTEKVVGTRNNKQVNLALPQFLKGYAGVISASGSAKSSYDNFEVREIKESDYPPAAVYPEGYLYYNDFSSVRSIDKEGWRLNGTKKDGFYILDGADDKDKIASNNYLTKVAGSTEWTDYVVEADVVLHDNGEYPQYTAIVARSTSTSNNGYELQLITKEEGTSLELRHRGKGEENRKLEVKNISVIPNEVHSMKMVVQGATITCYFDGVKMFDVTDEINPYLKGYAGVRSSDGTAQSSFDYFAVRKITDDDMIKDPIIKKQDGDIWFFDDFLGEESMTERGWSTDKVAIRNGSAFITTRVVADKIQDADKWTDYEVSAIVYVDKEAGIHGTATSGATAIVARSLSSTSGYEFGILTSGTSTSYLRLLDRKTGLNIGEDKTTKITAGEHELRMVCIGKEIYCYFDGSLVIAVQSDSWAAGYAGMRAANVDSYYKDFTVRKARPVTTTIRPSGTVSPATGDAGVNSAVIYAAALMLSLSMIGLVVTATYSRKRR